MDFFQFEKVYPRNYIGRFLSFWNVFFLCKWAGKQTRNKLIASFEKRKKKKYDRKNYPQTNYIKKKKKRFEYYTNVRIQIGGRALAALKFERN